MGVEELLDMMTFIVTCTGVRVNPCAGVRVIRPCEGPSDTRCRKGKSPYSFSTPHRRSERDLTCADVAVTLREASEPPSRQRPAMDTGGRRRSQRRGAPRSGCCG